MKMMKRSKMTVLLSALLCAVLLLSSCGTSAAIPSDDEETVKLPASEIISSVSSGASAAPSLDSTTAGGDDGEELTMSEALAVWKNYLLYEEPEKTTVDTYVFNVKEDGGVNFDFSWVSRIAQYTVTVDNDALDFAVNYYGVKRGTVYYRFVDLLTGKTVTQFEYSIDAAASNLPSYTADIEYISYDFAVLCVTKTTPTPVYANETPAEDEDPLYYDFVDTETFYAPDGTVLASGEAGKYDISIKYSGDQYTIFALAGKAYTVVDGEIVATCADGMETLPLVGWDFEYNGYRYWLDYYSIIVTDEASNIVACYDGDVNLYSLQVLSNGNIYFYTMKWCADDATEYSFCEDGEKLLFEHTLINVETGTVTHPELGFGIVDLVTNFSAQNNNKVNDDLNIASVYRYADGKLDSTTTNLVLDGNMNVVATLPNVVPNQNGLLTRLGGDSWKLRTCVEYTTSVSYFISSNGNLILLPDDNDVDAICNGFFMFNGDIYTHYSDLVVEATEWRGYHVFNSGNSIAILDDEDVLTVYTITSDGRVTSKSVSDVAYISYDDLDDSVLSFYYKTLSGISNRKGYVDATGNVLYSSNGDSYDEFLYDNYIVLRDMTLNGTSYEDDRYVLIYVK